LPLLQQLATDASIPVAERLRYFRALDFFPTEERQRALLAILATPAGRSVELTPVILGQLDAKAAAGNEDVQAALQRALPSVRGTTKYVDLVERYDARTQVDELIRLALDKPNETAGVEAGRLALAWGAAPRFAQIIHGNDERATRRALIVLGRNYTPAVDSLITALALDTTRALDLRRAAVQSMGTGYGGWLRIVTLARTNTLPESLKPTAATALFSAWPELRDSAAKYGLAPPPATTADGKTLPPLMILASRGGDASAGRAVFTRTCAACHLAAGTGTDFGPALTEIGDKLPKSGLLLAILDPSAGIAFGYEGWSIRTNDGQQLVGMITSETDDEVAMKLIGGIQRRVPKSSIVERKRMDASLMPQGLERTMTETDLTNLVEYLSSLHKAR